MVIIMNPSCYCAITTPAKEMVRALIIVPMDETIHT